jgi:hypothetical protein
MSLVTLKAKTLFYVASRFARGVIHLFQIYNGVEKVGCIASCWRKDVIPKLVLLIGLN